MITIYEYARSCGKIHKCWTKWLNSLIPTSEVVELDEPTIVYNEKVKVRVSDVFRSEYPSGIPVWPRDALANSLVRSLPSLLREVGLAPLVACLPSFSLPWANLPEEERETAMRLLKRRAAVPFRDASKQVDPFEPVYRVAIDVDLASPSQIVDAFKVWLKDKQEPFKPVNPYLITPSKPNPYLGPSIPRIANLGGSVARPYEKLRWLAAYRFMRNGSYKQAIGQMDALTKIPAKKPSKEFLRLPYYEDQNDFSRAAGKAKHLMDEMATPAKGIFIPSLFPHLW